MTGGAVDREVAKLMVGRFKGKAEQVARSTLLALDQVEGKPDRVREELVVTLYLSFVGVLFKEGHIVIKEKTENGSSG